MLKICLSVCLMLTAASAVAQIPVPPVDAGQPDDRPDRDETRDRRQSAPASAPPLFMPVLTEREKQCRQRRGCPMVGPCPPCQR